MLSQFSYEMSHVYCLCYFYSFHNLCGQLFTGHVSVKGQLYFFFTFWVTYCPVCSKRNGIAVEDDVVSELSGN